MNDVTDEQAKHTEQPTRTPKSKWAIDKQCFGTRDKKFCLVLARVYVRWSHYHTPSRQYRGPAVKNRTIKCAIQSIDIRNIFALGHARSASRIVITIILFVTFRVEVIQNARRSEQSIRATVMALWCTLYPSTICILHTHTPFGCSYISIQCCFSVAKTC